MNERTIEDLSSWEAGDLSLAELERLRAGVDVQALVTLYERLNAIAAEPVPDTDAGWIAVQERIEAHPKATHRRGGRVLVLAVAAAVLSASAALAAPEAVHAVVDGVRHGVDSLLGTDRSSTAPPALLAPGTSVPSAGDADSSTTGVGSSSGGTDGHDSGSGGAGTEGDQGSSGSDGGTSQGSDGGSGDQQQPAGSDQSGDGGSGDQQQPVGSDQSGDGGSGSGDQQSGSGDQGTLSGN